MPDEKNSLEALDRVDEMLKQAKVESKSIPDLCNQYRALKPLLEGALFAIGLIPGIGPKIVAAIKFLMQIADAACPAPAAGR